MRLKKLELQAFGPFKERVVIDFEKDKIDRGLLLISGDTGAGKTTIFDAICYALFGQTSGEVRTTNSLRSDWALPDVDTYVDLEFYYKNKLYEVKRSPEYNRRKKNGEGQTKQPAKADANIDGKIITKFNEVTMEIEKLIGLDYKQFRQVAMLSQGEFTKFLLASSEEKTTIFRKIFGTEFYDRLQNNLKENRLVKEEEIKRIKDKIDTEKTNLEEIINVYGMNDEEVVKALKEKIKEDTEKVLLTKTNRDKTKDKEIKLTNELNNLDALNKKIKDYESSQEELAKLLLENINIEEEKKRYEYNVNVAYQITDIMKNIEKDNKLLESKSEKARLDKETLASKEKEYDVNKEKYASLNNYSKDVDKINDEINDLVNKIKDFDSYISKKKELDKVENEYRINSDNYENQNNLYESMRKKYYLNVAVEIAENLNDDEPCPVCGSTNHPHKAQEVDCDYTKEDLNLVEKELKIIDQARKSNEAKIEELRKNIMEFNIPTDIDIFYEKERINKLLLDKQKEKIDLDREFKKMTNEKESLMTSINNLKNNIGLLSEDIKNYESNIKEYEINLNNIYQENETNYQDYISKRLDRLALTNLKNKIDKFDKRKQELEAFIKVLEEEVKDKKVVDLSEKKKALEEIRQEHKELDELYTSLNSLLEKLKFSTSNIEKYIDISKKIENEYAVIKMLSDTANGNLIGKQKITFENYVQSYFMKTVLIEANKRLAKMTDSRYELKKKETEIKINSKTGLDFSVFDSYTGKERDVTSLSGGEKFKASLALALGLSDTISNSHGGIKIDSLFIDEGFGSLDSESLNQALNILVDLSGNDKLVGVISHVSELMNIIDNKILVTKTNTGSMIRVSSVY